MQLYIVGKFHLLTFLDLSIAGAEVRSDRTNHITHEREETDEEKQLKMSMRAMAEQKTAAVEQKRRVSEAKVKSLLGMQSRSPPLSSASSSSPCSSSSSSSSAVHHSHTAPAPAPADYVDHHSGDDGDGDAQGHGQGPGQGSVCPLEMRYGLGVQRPLAAFEAMSGVCFGTLTVVAPRLQKGWCLCEGEGDGELSGLFEALSASGAGTDSGQAEGQEQEQREGSGHEEERDAEGVGEGGAFRESHVTGEMSSAALQALDLVRSYL
jgi:hypothetical protein